MTGTLHRISLFHHDHDLHFCLVEYLRDVVLPTDLLHVTLRI